MKRRFKVKGFSSFLVVVILLSALTASSLWAGEGAKFAAAYLKREPIPSCDPNLTMDQAMKIQAEFVAALKPAFGKVVGYKAGLTNPNVQKAFGVTAPVRGTLLEKMILKSGAEVPAA
ncbi:MAG TPA: hypothetical protein P5196_10435, partial [Syntrophales bacterium]|nr:hypothetical protein [Syntrophales bacterium]